MINKETILLSAASLDISEFNPKQTFFDNRGYWPKCEELAKYSADIRTLVISELVKNVDEKENLDTKELKDKILELEQELKMTQEISIQRHQAAEFYRESLVSLRNQLRGNLV